MENIIFIGGAHGRSGTTFMKRLLCLHPQVSWVLGNETQYLEMLADFVPHLLDFGAYLPRNTGLAFRRFKESVVQRFGNTSAVNGTLQSLEKRLISDHIYVPRFGNLPLINPLSEREVAEVFDEFTHQLFSQTLVTLGTKFACEKTPSNAQYLGLVHTLFPNARMIVMIRHPLHTALSFLPKDWGPSDPLEAAYFTHVYHARWRSICQNTPDSYYRLIRLEDLIQYPEEHLHQVGEFIGLSWKANHLKKALGLFNIPEDRRVSVSSEILNHMENILDEDIKYFQSLGPNSNM